MTVTESMLPDDQGERTSQVVGYTPNRSVVICDDTAEIRRSLQAALAMLPGLVVAGEAWDVMTCGELVRRLSPDLVVLDVNIPGGGVSAARLVKSIRRSTLILAYSGRHETVVRDAMLAAGAAEFVLKTGRVRPLLDAVRRVAAVPATLPGQQA